MLCTHIIANAAAKVLVTGQTTNPPMPGFGFASLKLRESAAGKALIFNSAPAVPARLLLLYLRSAAFWHTYVIRFPYQPGLPNNIEKCFSAVDRQTRGQLLAFRAHCPTGPGCCLKVFCYS